MPKPFKEWVASVIDEELPTHCPRSVLPEPTQEALRRIETRVAEAMEHLHQETGCRCGDAHISKTS